MIFYDLLLSEYLILLIIYIFYWVLGNSVLRKVFIFFISSYLIGYYNFNSLVYVFILIILTYVFIIFLNNIRNEDLKTFLYWFSYLSLLLLFFISEYFNEKGWFFGLGFGFLILQSISFISDIYFDRFNKNLDFFNFILYFTYFPKFFVGPVEKTSNLYSAFSRNFNFDFNLFNKGLIYILIGSLKKFIIS
jgi:D-alanyl-lipoteichoic acid acyltransferase DltB (MBOAT superfamily)